MASGSELLAEIPLGPEPRRGQGGSLSDRAFGETVRQHATALRPLVEMCVESSGAGREKDLVVALGLDRTVVGRIFRASRTRGNLEFVHELPSPEGLRLVFSAAVQAGLLSGPAGVRAVRAVDAFESFVSGYPGKRRAFLLRLATRLPRERAAADRNARRAMYRAATDVLGYRLRHAVVSMVVADGSDPVRFDTQHLFAKYGLERTRPDGPPIVVGAMRTGPDGPGCVYMPIDPDADPADPCSALLSEWCSGPATVGFFQTSSGFVELQVPADQPRVHEPLNIVCAQRAPGVLLRRAREGYSHEWRRVVTRIPSRRLTVDFILGPGVYEHATISVSEHLYRPELPSPPGDGPRQAEELLRYASIEDLGLGLDRIGIDGCPGYDECVRRMVGLASLDPTGCRVVRVTKDYPELNSSLLCWIPLTGDSGPGQESTHPE